MERLYGNGDAVYSITSCLEAEDCVCFLMTNRRLYEHRSDDRFWRQLCSTSFGVAATVGPDQAVLPSFEATFLAWKSSFARYSALKVRRVFAFWTEYLAWASEHFPEVLPTLNGPASEQQLQAVEHDIQRPLPDALRLLYRFHAGQTMIRHGMGRRSRLTPAEAMPVICLGMFGGYMFYDHVQTCRLLDLQTLAALNRAGDDVGVLFAASHNLLKHFVLEPTSVRVLTHHRHVKLPCHPPAEDPLLAWLEEFMARLRSGAYQPSFLRTPENLSDAEPDEGIWSSQRVLSLCPTTQALGCSAAVTQGIQVTASAAFVPELCTDTHNQWTYTIRIRAIQGQCPYTRVQLTRRHWVIEHANGAKEEVDSEAVVGMYPKFGPPEMERGFEFLYASASRGQMAATMSGYFTFVPGTKDAPTGEPFEVQVAPFALQIPQFIY